VTEPDNIIKEVEKANKANVRVFTFGIAQNLDVPLLDRIAETTGGYSEYVAPGREIEAKISSFFRKVSYPVLSELSLDFGKIKVSDVYPQHLPDLFRGSQVIAFGRYNGSGDVAVTLTGTVEGRQQKFVYDATFPEQQTANDFLAQLWARRKIGYLLDQVRLHGKSNELVDEVVRLSKEYGIATPYTSYLVLENEEAYRQAGIVSGDSLRKLRDAGVAMNAPTAAQPEQARARLERESGLAADRFAMEGGYRGGAGGAMAGPAAAAPEAPGRQIALSERLKDWKGAEALSEADKAEGGGLKRVAGRTFVLVGGAYVDTAFTAQTPMLQIKWGSDAYFNVLAAMPQMKDYLALGESVVVVIGQKALVVSEEGKEAMSPDEIKAYFAD
jgi:Ca-activated chloride channel family protein